MARRPKSKTLVMLVAVRVPTAMTISQAKREVRTRVNEQCGYYDRIPCKDRHGDYDYLYLEDSDVKVRRMGPAMNIGSPAVVPTIGKFSADYADGLRGKRG